MPQKYGVVYSKGAVGILKKFRRVRLVGRFFQEIFSSSCCLVIYEVMLFFLGFPEIFSLNSHFHSVIRKIRRAACHPLILFSSQHSELDSEFRCLCPNSAPKQVRKFLLLLLALSEFSKFHIFSLHEKRIVVYKFYCTYLLSILLDK